MRGLLHAKPCEVLMRRHAHLAREAPRERRPRGPRAPRQLTHGPTPPRLRVHPAQGGGERPVAERAQPARAARRLRVRPGTKHLHQEDLEPPGDDDGGASLSPFVLPFEQRHRGQQGTRVLGGPPQVDPLGKQPQHGMSPWLVEREEAAAQPRLHAVPAQRIRGGSFTSCRQPLLHLQLGAAERVRHGMPITARQQHDVPLPQRDGVTALREVTGARDDQMQGRRGRGSKAQPQGARATVRQ